MSPHQTSRLESGRNRAAANDGFPKAVQVNRLGSVEARWIGFSASVEGRFGGADGRCRVGFVARSALWRRTGVRFPPDGFELDGWDVTEVAVKAFGVVPVIQPSVASSTSSTVFHGARPARGHESARSCRAR
jgi:hypothetical protein